MATVALPVIPNFCNLAVFPSPSNKDDESRFFLLNNSAVVPAWSFKTWLVEYIPGSVYCLLPSDENNKWMVSIIPSKQALEERFSYCLEINMDALVSTNVSSGSSAKDESPTKQYEGPVMGKQCSKCFVSHFPHPNTKICKLGKESKRKRKENSSSKLVVRLRGGAKENDESSALMIEKGTRLGLQCQTPALSKV